MGAKAPEPIKKPRQAPRCDVCGRKFMSLQALRSHYKCLHANSVAAKKKQANAKLVKKKMVPVEMLKKVITSKQVKKTEEVEKSEPKPETAAKPMVGPRKPVFECPVCAEHFPVYFTAFRHIQKNHCVDEKGAKVPPNSPHLIKPIRIEICASCCQEIRSTIPHNCVHTVKDQYVCLGCNQFFNGISLFQNHVRGLHADDAINYFFPSRDEFLTWKLDMQKHAKTKFVQLNKQKGKEIYHCSHQPNTVASAIKLCPSMFTVREYLKGVHVYYTTEHHGHRVDKTPLNKYSGYSISMLTSKESNASDLYQQFKKTISSIVIDAEKADVETLKLLLDKALKMTQMLESCLVEDSISNKNLSDDQICKSLDGMKTRPNKRRQVLESKKIEPKKIKKSISTEKSVENGMKTRHSKTTSTISKSVTTKNLLKKNEEASDKDIEELLENEGEELQAKAATKRAEEKAKLDKLFDELIAPKKIEVPDKREDSTPTRSLLQSPSSFNDSYKNFVDQNFKNVSETSTPKPKPNLKRKEVVKTKIGQFKVKPASPKELSPRSPKERPVKEVTKAPVTSIPFKIKPDIEYVVKEQENDCNILILKI